MTKARTLDKRRQAVRNIRKITRTMELIATARFRRAADRALAAAAYLQRMTALVDHLQQAKLAGEHPLLARREPERRAVLLVLTANRGLCGGYNSNVLRMAINRWSQLREAVAEPALEVSGKRGFSALRFRKIAIAQAYTQFDDKPQLTDVEQIALRYLDEFRRGRLDRVEVAYTKLESISRQQPVVETLLPLAASTTDQHDKHTPGVQYDFLPSPEAIFEELLPSVFRAKLLKCFLDAAASEQIARMIAMKAATENADSMIAQLGMTYNRARQTQITSEILEVVSAAEALAK